MVSKFPVSFDPAKNIITLDGPGGASVMLAFLLKAKFGEALDPEVLFHEPLADLMVALRKNSHTPESGAKGAFSAEFLQELARRILARSHQSKWWQMSKTERVDYVRNIVAAPHAISDLEIEAVIEGVEDGLSRCRDVVRAAD